MRHVRRHALPVVIAAVLAALLAACREPEPMPLSPSATWLVESPPIAAGNPFEMLLFIRTPAGHRVHAYTVPELEGIDVVERRILPTSQADEVGVHREAFIARTRAPGLHRWPASEVRVTDASGATYTLALDGLELDVPSVLGEGAPPRRPRGYREAPPGPRGAPFGLGFVTGALAMGALALLLLRRERRRSGAPEAAERTRAASRRRYFGGSARLGRRLEAARDAVDRDVDGAAADAALALRHWAADRFLVSTHAGASEELRRARPAQVDASLWSAWLDRLDAIEGARFGARTPGERAAALARAIESALSFAEQVDRRGAPAETAR